MSVCDFLRRLAERRGPARRSSSPSIQHVRQWAPAIPVMIDVLADWIERFCDDDQAESRLARSDDARRRRRPDRFRSAGSILSDSASSLARIIQARHAESEEMYARMLGISRAAGGGRSNAEADPDYLEVARLELYRGQCGSAYAAWRLGRARSAASSKCGLSPLDRRGQRTRRDRGEEWAACAGRRR